MLVRGGWDFIHGRRVALARSFQRVSVRGPALPLTSGRLTGVAFLNVDDIQHEGCRPGGGSL